MTLNEIEDEIRKISKQAEFLANQVEDYRRETKKKAGLEGGDFSTIKSQAKNLFGSARRKASFNEEQRQNYLFALIQITIVPQSVSKETSHNRLIFLQWLMDNTLRYAEGGMRPP